MVSRPLLYDVKGAGEPIVLFPGGLTGWRSWVPFVGPLAQDRQVIRLQLRSVELAEAGTSYPPGCGTLTEREGLRAAVDQLGLDRFDLVGWSYGGHVSLAFTLEYPERVRTLTVIEPPAYWILREMGYDSNVLNQAEARDRSLTGKKVTLDDLKEFVVLHLTVVDNSPRASRPTSRSFSSGSSLSIGVKCDCPRCSTMF